MYRNRFLTAQSTFVLVRYVFFVVCTSNSMTHTNISVLNRLNIRMMTSHHCENICTDIRLIRYGGIRRSSASPRSPRDGIPSASVCPSPRTKRGLPCPYPSDRTSRDANMKPVDAPSVWSSTTVLDKKESDGWDPPQGVPPHALRNGVGAHELRR